MACVGPGAVFMGEQVAEFHERVSGCMTFGAPHQGDQIQTYEAAGMGCGSLFRSAAPGNGAVSIRCERDYGIAVGDSVGTFATLITSRLFLDLDG